MAEWIPRWQWEGVAEWTSQWKWEPVEEAIHISPGQETDEQDMNQGQKYNLQGQPLVICFFIQTSPPTGSLESATSWETNIQTRSLWGTL